MRAKKSLCSHQRGTTAARHSHLDILELRERRENNPSTLICLEYSINYEILGCKQKLTLEKTRGIWGWGWNGTQVLRESKRRMWVGPGKVRGGAKSLISPQLCSPGKEFS